MSVLLEGGQMSDHRVQIFAVVGPLLHALLCVTPELGVLILFLYSCLFGLLQFLQILLLPLALSFLNRIALLPQPAASGSPGSSASAAS